MTNFFPIPSKTDGLHIDTGERERWGGKIITRNEPRWHEIGAERDFARLVATKWRDAAVHDGWTIGQTYAHEDFSRAATLKLFSPPQGLFVVHVLTRPNVLAGDNWSLGCGEVHCWGPDELSILAPLEYPGQQYFHDALYTCPHCHTGPNAKYFGETDVPSPHVKTVRYGFAGRACEACAPELRKKYERSGWYD